MATDYDGFIVDETGATVEDSECLPIESPSAAWNDGYYLEGMDRAHCAIESIEMFLSDHPAVIRAGQQANVKLAISILDRVY